MTRPPAPFVTFPLVALILASCGGEDTPGLVERSLSESEKSFRIVETSMDRFR
jgi:hypothetical protein